MDEATTSNGDGFRKAGASLPFLSNVRIRNYKSIELCDLDLRPLTVLVGRNGSGKSNFIDAIRFVSDALETSLDNALRTRGGIDQVRRRSTGHPRNFSLELSLNLSFERTAKYAFEIAARPKGGFVVKREELEIRLAAGRRESYYRLEADDKKEMKVVDCSEKLPVMVDDRLSLVAASSLSAFRPAYDALLSTGFYSVNPDVMRKPQAPDAGELLHSDGWNIASVIGRLERDDPGSMERINQYLGAIVPEVQGVGRVSIGPMESVQLMQKVKGSSTPWRFYALSMSDGTLRALGSLVAVLQLAHQDRSVRLVAIEEPESALHPAAVAALMDALREAAMRTQVLITTHSPDLLDNVNPDTDALFVVQLTEGVTQIAPADGASLSAIRDHLYTAGELLRMDQLLPDEKHLQRQRGLFEPSEKSS